MQSMVFSSLASSYFWYGLLVFILVYLTALAVYRRFFHPLAHIPGPFLPAVTTLYQSYYNGRYYREIERLHSVYGPVVRIQPNEIHLSNPDNFDKIYYIGSRYSKSPVFYSAFCIPHATFSTPSNELHKHKRAMLNPMFSRKMVLQLEDVVHDKANRVVNLVSRAIQNHEPVDLHHAFRCVSVDVITEYAFDRSFDLLDSADLGSHFFRMCRGIGAAMYFFQQFPLLQKLVSKIPPSIAYHMGGAMKQVISLQQEGVKQIEDVKERIEAGKIEGTRPTIFSELLNPSKQDGWPVPSTNALKDEVYSILAAASDTTGNAMTVACFHILRNKAIYHTLHAELHSAFPDPHSKLDFVTLERLPYLTGVIKEGLRLSFGVPGRLPRVVPEPGATFDGYHVPAGTIVGMSSWIMQRNPSVFPNPMTFDPTRWLNPEESRKLDKHMIPFGGGSRVCVGMPLAYCELYVTLGTFFHRFRNLDVYKTTEEDLGFEDFFSAYQIYGKNWLKAVATY